MSCEKITDLICEQENAPFWEAPLLDRLRVAWHLFACPACAEKAARYELCRKAMREGFLPPAPELESAVMAAIAEEEGALGAKDEEAAPAGFPLRGWVAAGLVLLVSLSTVFFGMEFNNIALAAGMSFMLPIGITVGVALTVYGAIFIASHLKRLSERFDLQSR